MKKIIINCYNQNIHFGLSWITNSAIIYLHKILHLLI